MRTSDIISFGWFSVAVRIGEPAVGYNLGSFDIPNMSGEILVNVVVRVLIVTAAVHFRLH